MGKTEEDFKLILDMYNGSDCREYIKRCKESKSFRALTDSDREIFRFIDKDIQLKEEDTKTTFVYLTEAIFNDIKRYAGLRMTERTIKTKVGVYGGKWDKLMIKYPLLRERIAEWGEELLASAMEVMANDIIENKSVKSAKFVIERLDKRFVKNIGIEHKGAVEHNHSISTDKIMSLRDEMQRAKNKGNIKQIEEKPIDI